MIMAANGRSLMAASGLARRERKCDCPLSVDALMLGETVTHGRAADDRAACHATSGPASPGLHTDGDPGVLAANADGDVLQRYDEDLDAAFGQAREQGDVTPLVQTVKRWWFEADAWRDPQAQREFWLASTPTKTRVCRLRNSE